MLTLCCLSPVPPATMPKHHSPAKKVWSLKRLLTFCIQRWNSKKLPSLTMSKVEETSYTPSKPTLSIYTCKPISITRIPKQLTTQCVKTATVPPRPVYHPAIIRGCLSMFGKTPPDLDPDEIAKFNQYRAWKWRTNWNWHYLQPWQWKPALSSLWSTYLIYKISPSIV